MGEEWTEKMVEGALIDLVSSKTWCAFCIFTATLKQL